MGEERLRITGQSIDADYELFKITLDKEPEKFSEATYDALYNGDNDKPSAIMGLTQAIPANDAKTLYKFLYYVQIGKTMAWKQLAQDYKNIKTK